MNPLKLTFTANEQALTKTDNFTDFASNTVSYIEATFTLGENWTGYDSVRAVWKTDYYTISTVLDANFTCIVPTEVLRYKAKVFVNLVGSIVENDTLTDRLTTFPVLALTVKANAAVNGSETAPVTPSQFEQFVDSVRDAAGSISDYSYDSEAWAVGTRGGVNVPSTDPTFHNNSKYWAEQNAGLADEVADLKSDLNLLICDIGQTDLESGGWSNNAKVSDNKRIRIKNRINVSKGDIITFSPNGLYGAFEVYADASASTPLEVSGWVGGSSAVIKRAVANDGVLTVAFANGADWGASTTIAVSDYSATTTILLKYISTLINDLESVDDALNEATTQYNSVLEIKSYTPANWLDETALTTGRILWNGTMDSSASYKTSDYIPVSNGDVLRFFKGFTNPDTGRVELEKTTGERLALYDANKSYLAVSGQYPCNTSTGYTVSNASAKYIRISYSSSFDPVELTINASSIPAYSKYFVPYKDSDRLVHIEDILGASVKKIIDCWGDSRTEMNIGTSYSDYLGTLLGNDFIVTNRGISGQSIGQVGFRFGSNEVFLTLANNQIPASGAVDVTGVVCSVGSRQGYNMETADDTRGSRCAINGVQGTFVYHRSGSKTFTRDADGVAVRVFPQTKAVPEPYFASDHMQILWAGKNDFSYSAPYTVSGIEDNYDAMVSKIPHSKFIILGETYSNTDDYASGSTGRTNVDAINTYLSTKYPNNFINIQTELVSNGLTLESITPTAQDTTDIANGFIPSSLMADATHPNQYGREAIAKIIYGWMQTKNWI